MVKKPFGTTVPLNGMRREIVMHMHNCLVGTFSWTGFGGIYCSPFTNWLSIAMHNGCMLKFPTTFGMKFHKMTFIWTGEKGVHIHEKWYLGGSFFTFSPGTALYSNCHHYREFSMIQTGYGGRGVNSFVPKLIVHQNSNFPGKSKIICSYIFFCLSLKIKISAIFIIEKDDFGSI
jgi:hypothetical protein